AARRTHPYQFRSPAVRGPLHVLPACRARALSGRSFFFCAVFTALLRCFRGCVTAPVSLLTQAEFINAVSVIVIGTTELCCFTYALQRRELCRFCRFCFWY
ncbi:unnamed protein product, partial [Pelagomonas calceolata]